MEKTNYLDHIDPTNAKQLDALALLAGLSAHQCATEEVLDELFDDNVDAIREFIQLFGFPSEDAGQFEAFYDWLDSTFFSLTDSIPPHGGIMTLKPEWVQWAIKELREDGAKEFTPQFELRDFMMLDQLLKSLRVVRDTTVLGNSTPPTNTQFLDRYRADLSPITAQLMHQLNIHDIENYRGLADIHMVDPKAMINFENAILALFKAVNEMILAVEDAQDRTVITLKPQDHE